MPRLELLGSKEPVPLVVQSPPVAIRTEPLRVTALTSAQTVWSLPALALGTSVKVINRSSETALQTPLPIEVSVSVTEPASVSAEEGV